MTTLERINKCLELQGLTVTEDNPMPELDSLDWVELVLSIEDEFGIEVPHEDFSSDKIKTVRDAVDYLDHRTHPDGN